MVFARTRGGTGNGNDVVNAHDQISHDHGLDRSPELVAALNVGMSVVIRHQQLDANPQQQRRTHQFQKWHLQQGQRKGDQYHAQHNRPGSPPQDTFDALMRGQLATCQRDDDGIVSAQQDVDHDDLTNGEPKMGC